MITMEYRKNKIRRIPELLAPAGNFEKLVTAIHYGADAIYLGGKNFSLRAHAANFSEDELKKAVAYAHDRSVKVYAAVNILAHNDDLNDLADYLLHLKKIEVDGLIISDPGILAAAKRITPDIPIHLSTQANVTNVESALFWQNQGVRRINPARELSLAEIKAFKKIIQAEIEIFVHGALCISYSGRCLLSYYLTGRDANRGICAQPCRYGYALLEEKRPGQYFPVEENGRGTYIFNSRDLCLLARLPELIATGVHSLKIEGRMKSIYYVGSVVRVYRAALDLLAETAPPDDSKHGPGLTLPDRFMRELLKTGSRGYTENFFNGPPDAKDMLYKSPRIEQSHIPAGVVREPGRQPIVEVRNPIRPGDKLEYLKQGLDQFYFKIDEIRGRDGAILKQANPGNMVTFKTMPPAKGWKKNTLLRKKSPDHNG